jgi:hypothetical protein
MTTPQASQTRLMTERLLAHATAQTVCRLWCISQIFKEILYGRVAEVFEGYTDNPNKTAITTVMTVARRLRNYKQAWIFLEDSSQSHSVNCLVIESSPSIAFKPKSHGWLMVLQQANVNPMRAL